MSRRGLIVAVLATLGVNPALGDEVLYSYEGDVLPYEAPAPWEVFNPCEEPCMESIVHGHFVLQWPEGGDLIDYHLWITYPPEPPPAHTLGRVAVPLQPPERADFLYLRCVVYSALRGDE